MLFVIDIGNSHTVIGLYDQDTLQGQWRIKTDKQKTADEIGIQFFSLCSISGLDPINITDIIISSVVPSLESAWLKCCNKYFSKTILHKPFIISHENLRTLIDVQIDYPSEVGADRLVNSIGAWSQYKSNLIVIDFGTAITFDCITDKCEYLGGTILPGIAISMDALSSRAAKLPHIDISSPPESVIGKNTVQAMKSGILHGYGSLIDGLINKLKQQFCDDKATFNVIATGGMANLITPYSEKVKIVDDKLTLKGFNTYTKLPIPHNLI